MQKDGNQLIPQNLEQQVLLETSANTEIQNYNWQTVAKIMDRLFLFIFFTATVIVTVYFLVIMPRSVTPSVYWEGDNPVL